MVSHLLKVGSGDYTSEINIQEDNKECIVVITENNNTAEAYLSIQQLHDFIGTLLHVQQKIKNK